MTTLVIFRGAEPRFEVIQAYLGISQLLPKDTIVTEDIMDKIKNYYKTSIEQNQTSGYDSFFDGCMSRKPYDPFLNTAVVYRDNPVDPYTKRIEAICDELTDKGIALVM